MSLSQSKIWLPTQVQVTVVRASDLKPKGKSRTNDVYTIIQLGKEKYSTSVAEKTLNPTWREEASFEICPDGNTETLQLCLLVMHRSLVGLDRFLGQKTINLNSFFNNKDISKTVWYALDSKPGKKFKERGKIQVTIQFMGNNKTSSMFELSVQPKSRSPFLKLRDKMKSCKQQGWNPDTTSVDVPAPGQHCSTDKLQHHALKQGALSQTEPKSSHSVLVGRHRLSAAQSLSSLPGSNSSSKMDHVRGHTSFNCHFNTKEEAFPDQLSSEPITTNSNTIPKKYATLPRSYNPFDVDQKGHWESAEQSGRIQNGGPMDRSTKKKRRNMNEYGRSSSSLNLRSANPFTKQSLQDHNPFSASYSANESTKMPIDNDISAKQWTSGTVGHNQKNDSAYCQASSEQYSNLSFDEVVRELLKEKEVVKKKDAHIRELEDYIDNLLVRVMEETPSILRIPYEPKRKAEKIVSK